jgi:hypothetical protein
MRRLAVGICLAIFIFSAGVAVGVRLQSHPSLSQAPATVEQHLEDEWPLTREIVSRSLQTQVFRTNKLRRNSDPEIVWRWLKQSIDAYPQNWIKLNISDEQIYGVVLYPQKTLDIPELNHYNKELKERGMSPLREGKRYLPIQVYKGGIICPNWTGLVDVEEARLVYFAGVSG